MNEGLIVLVRAFIGFFTLLIFARILGKQQISQLTFFDYVLGITIGSTASTLTTDLTSRAWPHWVGLFVWTFLCFILQWASIKNKTVAEYLDGKPTVVIMNGKVLENSMKKYRYTLADLLEQLRDKGIFDIGEVAYAILEKDGQLSILKKPEFDTPTRQDLNITPGATSIGTELIYDGVVVEENLEILNKSKDWLKNELKKQNINDFSKVFVATFNPPDKLYVDLYKDKASSKK